MEKQKTQLENLLEAVKQGIDSQNERKLFERERANAGNYLNFLNSVKSAYEFAENAHKGQFRADGKTPYITHPVAVAHRLATEFERCGERFQSSERYVSSSNYISFVQAGLLHDVVEDCGIALEEIAKEFGNEVAFLVDGMTKVAREKDGKIESDKDATLRKIAAYGFKDPRLFLIKLCDVAHNSSGIANSVFHGLEELS